MSSNAKKVLLVVLCMVLAAEAAFLASDRFLPTQDDPIVVTHPQMEDVTQAPTETTEPPTQPPTEEQTEPPTEEPTEPPTEEPEDNRYVLTFVGDCTLGSVPGNWNNQYHFVGAIGTDYSYPFANVVEYFENDDFTMINLEGVLADSGTAASKRFAFRGPTAYTAIMTGASVEAVTLANNHTGDYGKAGYASTTEALESAGIAYVEEDKTTLFTTESGLTIGLYADAFDLSTGDIQANISSLKKAGAEVIVCAFHWGAEGAYRPSATQQKMAHAAIDAGADIVYGHHPHVLQRIEEYGDGIIYYSLGNFSFGGASYPQDFDSAMVQQELIRNEDGSVSLGELTIIPVCISSISGRNNFQPTPLEPGTVYDRVMSKLDGSFKGPDLVVDYSKLDPTEPSTEPPTEPQTPTETQPETPPATQPEAPPATQPEAPPATQPPAEGGSSGGGEEAVG